MQPITTSVIPSTSTPPSATDLDAIKARQQTMWASGDFGIIGTTLQIVGETLCEAVDLRAGSTVLDVAAGNGNCSLAAARRWCDVVSTDYVPALLEDGQRRAAGDRLRIRFQEADAEALPFDAASFDAVLSSFGVMFAPSHSRAALELLRVCRPGGKIIILNHFRSANRAVAWVERAISPFTVHIGFKSDLDLPAFLAQAELKPVSIEKVNIPRIWSLVTCRKA